MYKDYYKILGLHYSASQEDIKKKYRQLAKKWHPDVNQSDDATSKMQEITEAYLILSDEEARRRYDVIHEHLFRQKTEEKREESKEYFGEGKFKNETSTTEHSPEKDSSIPVDPILETWVSNARQQAKDFVIQSIKDAKGIITNGCKYTLYAIGVTIVLFVIILLILNIVGYHR